MPYPEKDAGYNNSGTDKLKRAFQQEALEAGYARTPRQKDRRQVTRDAYRSGDYKPTPSGGLTYSPFDPKRGDD